MYLPPVFFGNGHASDSSLAFESPAPIARIPPPPLLGLVLFCLLSLVWSGLGLGLGSVWVLGLGLGLGLNLVWVRSGSCFCLLLNIFVFSFVRGQSGTVFFFVKNVKPVCTHDNACTAHYPVLSEARSKCGQSWTFRFVAICFGLVRWVVCVFCLVLSCLVLSSSLFLPVSSLRRHLLWPRSVFLCVSFFSSFFFFCLVLSLSHLCLASLSISKGEDAGSHPAAALFDSKTKFSNGTVVKSLP